MMNQSRRKRLRYSRVFGCLLLFLAALFLAAWAASGIWRYVHERNLAASVSGKPVYYLLMGIDGDEPAHADSIILAAVHEGGKDISIISLPGDTRLGRDDEVNRPLRDTYLTGGVEETRSAVENLLHIRIDHYAVYDYQAFNQFADAFSDTELYVEEDMSHYDAGGEPDITLRRGFQNLSAGEALGYLRYKGEKETEIARIQREQRFLKAFLRDRREKGSFLSWFFTRRAWAPADSDLTPGDAAGLAYDLADYDEGRIHFLILPGELQTVQGKPFWIVNPVEIQKIIGLTLTEVPQEA